MCYSDTRLKAIWKRKWEKALSFLSRPCVSHAHKRKRTHISFFLFVPSEIIESCINSSLLSLWLLYTNGRNVFGIFCRLRAYLHCYSCRYGRHSWSIRSDFDATINSTTLAPLLLLLLLLRSQWHRIADSSLFFYLAKIWLSASNAMSAIRRWLWWRRQRRRRQKQEIKFEEMNVL